MVSYKHYAAILHVPMPNVCQLPQTTMEVLEWHNVLLQRSEPDNNLTYHNFNKLKTLAITCNDATVSDIAR